ncbi:hypothetical protein MKW94_007356, partial [Papaver nudicaule]|nr:hypothetical protein [Papaver nudicaule]
MDTQDLRCHSDSVTVLETPLDLLESRKKRRVSFADELTSVHIFQRDDSGSDQTPQPDNSPKPNNHSPPIAEEEEENDNDGDEPRNFVLDFPSPGTDFGSASTSNNGDDDGESWFGQVSASFIRGQQISASAASDDNSNNYETTLDSTEFKLHFQNHNQSDSEENLKTPTRSHLSLEWRTPSTGDLIDSTGNLMRGVNKPTPAASISGGKSSCGGDMSLLDENTRIYDYGMLSHTLEAKLAECRSIFDGISVSHH